MGGAGSNTTTSNRLDNVPEVMTGLSNGSPSNDPAMDCSWGRDEHPILKRVHEDVDESSGMACRKVLPHVDEETGDKVPRSGEASLYLMLMG